MVDEQYRTDVGQREDVRDQLEKGRKKGCRRRGCGLLVLLGLGLHALIIDIPNIVSYREREKAAREREMRGLCDAGPDETLAAAVIGREKHPDFIPVYGCATLTAYNRLAAQSGNCAFRRAFAEYEKNGECRFLPVDAAVVVDEVRLAAFAAQVRLEGEDAAWWAPCSGLKKP